MIENIECIQEFVSGMTFDEFEKDRRTQLAVHACLGIIGEAAKHIPADVQCKHPAIPWQKMRRMRNILVHEYDRVELDVVWNTIQHDLPLVLPKLREFRDNLD